MLYKWYKLVRRWYFRRWYKIKYGTQNDNLFDTTWKSWIWNLTLTRWIRNKDQVRTNFIYYGLFIPFDKHVILPLEIFFKPVAWIYKLIKFYFVQGCIWVWNSLRWNTYLFFEYLRVPGEMWEDQVSPIKFVFFHFFIKDFFLDIVYSPSILYFYFKNKYLQRLAQPIKKANVKKFNWSKPVRRKYTKSQLFQLFFTTLPLCYLFHTLTLETKWEAQFFRWDLSLIWHELIGSGEGLLVALTVWFIAVFFIFFFIYPPIHYTLVYSKVELAGMAFMIYDFFLWPQFDEVFDTILLHGEYSFYAWSVPVWFYLDFHTWQDEVFDYNDNERSKWYWLNKGSDHLQTYDFLETIRTLQNIHLWQLHEEYKKKLEEKVRRGYKVTEEDKWDPYFYPRVFWSQANCEVMRRLLGEISMSRHGMYTTEEEINVQRDWMGMYGAWRVRDSSLTTEKYLEIKKFLLNSFSYMTLTDRGRFQIRLENFEWLDYELFHTYNWHYGALLRSSIRKDFIFEMGNIKYLDAQMHSLIKDGVLKLSSFAVVGKNNLNEMNLIN